MRRAEGRLVEETIELLQQVTFVRVALDRLTWDRTPAFLARGLSPHDKAQLVCEYQFPVVDDRGTGNFQTLKKRVQAVAKTVLPSVVHFNHRRVALLRVTPELVQAWSERPLWFSLLHQTQKDGKNKVQHLARAQISLKQLLVVPFSIEKELKFDLSGFEIARNCEGSLQILVQLGSRHQSFAQRVEELRRKGLQRQAGSDLYRFVDPGQLSARLEENRRRKTPATEPNIPRSPVVEVQDVPHHSPSPLLASPRREEDPPLSGRSGQMTSSLVNGRWRTGSPEPPILSPAAPPPPGAGRQPPGSSSPSAGKRNSTGILMSAGPPADSPLLSPGLPLRRVERGVQSRDWRSSGSQTRPGERAASAQTDCTSDEDVPPPAPLRSGSPNTQLNETFTKASRKNGGRRPSPQKTVADRLKRLSSESKGSGYWLELTVHSAQRLPLVKGPDGGAPARPSVFVSYRADEELRASPLVEDSTDPVWNWTSRFLVSRERKNVVLKFWHRCPVRGERVLGFICLELPKEPPKEPATGDYDLVDLSQSSTGRVKITLSPCERREGGTPVFADESFNRFGAVAVCGGDEDVGHAGLLEPRTSPTDSDKATYAAARLPPSPSPRPSPVDPYWDMASKSFLEEKLRTDMTELDRLIGNLVGGYGYR